MTTQNYFILTQAESDAVVALGTSDSVIEPRAVDNGSPGTGINLNDNATDYDPGEAVTLTGRYVAPKRIVDDPTYPTAMKTALLLLPWATLENETIFAPSLI